MPEGEVELSASDAAIAYEAPAIEDVNDGGTPLVAAPGISQSSF